MTTSSSTSGAAIASSRQRRCGARFVRALVVPTAIALMRSLRQRHRVSLVPAQRDLLTELEVFGRAPRRKGGDDRLPVGYATLDVHLGQAAAHHPIEDAARDRARACVG